MIVIFLYRSYVVTFYMIFVFCLREKQTNKQADMKLYFIVIN